MLTLVVGAAIAFSVALMLMVGVAFGVALVARVPFRTALKGTLEVRGVLVVVIVLALGVAFVVTLVVMLTEGVQG